LRLAVVLVVLAAGLHLTAGTGWAEEGENTWRSTYDVVMLWVNFVILAFVGVKYGRKPLIEFLKNEGKRTAEDIEQAEQKKQRMDEEVKAMTAAAENSRERLRTLRERLIQEGEQKRLELIEAARRDSQLMLDQTRVRIEHQIFEARETLKAELVDSAIDAAIERLPSAMNTEDHSRFIERFIREA
jgi:F-type H+-transporting ATPase subunit b